MDNNEKLEKQAHDEIDQPKRVVGRIAPGTPMPIHPPCRPVHQFDNELDRVYALLHQQTGY
jgi:hypothetical protein